MKLIIKIIEIAKNTYLGRRCYWKIRLRRKTKILKQYYSITNPRCNNNEKMVICMIDGKIIHGGFSDRIRGITAMYQLCKKMGIDFKINFVCPFDLTNVLLPNKIDWRIREDEICYNPLDALPINVMDRTYQFSIARQKKLFRNLIRKKYKQIHLYTNADFTHIEGTYADLFHELFQISDNIKAELKLHLDAIGGEYINVATRFCDLLGDFPENHLIELTDCNKKILVERCVSKLIEIHNDTQCKIFVSSDSLIFIEEASKLDFTYSVKGSKVHIDRTDIRDFNILKNAVLDFFLIAYSTKIIQIKTDDMYSGSFSRSASYLNNVPFELMEF